MAKRLRMLYPWSRSCDCHRGGNIFRGVEASVKGIERASADYMACLPRLSSSCLQNIWKIWYPDTGSVGNRNEGTCRTVYQAEGNAPSEKGRTVIFAAGTGNPYFTTDTAASLRAMKLMRCHSQRRQRWMAFTLWPCKEPTAKKYDTVTYIDVLKKGLSIMDSTAISLCMDNNLPIVVFNLRAKEISEKFGR